MGRSTCAVMAVRIHEGQIVVIKGRGVDFDADAFHEGVDP